MCENIYHPNYWQSAGIIFRESGPRGGHACELEESLARALESDTGRFAGGIPSV